jgi:hypothetical protein
MPKPLVFELLASHTFRPADLGYLTSGGVVRADAFVTKPSAYLMPVRALETIDAGRRGRFIELSAPPGAQ